MQVQKIRVCVVVEPDEDRFYAYCPDLPGLHVDGETEAEAIDNAKDAVVAYVESLVKHGDPFTIGVIERQMESAVSRLMNDIKGLFSARQKAQNAHVADIDLPNCTAA